MNWAKNFVLRMAFVTMGYLSSAFAGSAQLLAQSRICNDPDAKPLYSMTQTNLPARLTPTLDAHLALMYYTTADLESRVNDMKTPMGTPLVQDKGDQFLVWNNATEHYDTLQAGLRVYDLHSGYKGVFTYNKIDNGIDVHNAGTNFSNRREVVGDAGAMLNITPPAVKVADKYIDSALNDLQQKYPEINKATTKVNFYSHSLGGAVVAEEMDHAREQGWQVGRSYFADPFYAGKMVNKIVRHTSEDQKQVMRDFYTNASITMDPAKANFIDWMPPFNLGKNIGTTLFLQNINDIGSHDIHNYVGRQTFVNTNTYAVADMGCKVR